MDAATGPGHAGQVRNTRRYRAGARWYDLISFERPVYRAGRVAGIAALALRAGARVLDVGCGTGLNFPLLREAVGAGGEIVGLDASAAMLRRAQARVHRRGWINVHLVQGDATALASLIGDHGGFGGHSGDSGFDAVLFTYSLSVIRDWRPAWAQALAVLRSDGRVAVVDLALPGGRWTVLAPLARLACLAGGSDPYRYPWRELDGAADRTHRVLRGGHIHAVAATAPGAADPPARAGGR